MIKVNVRWLDSYLEIFECDEVRAGYAFLWMKLTSGENRQIPMINIRWFSQTPESHAK